MLFFFLLLNNIGVFMKKSNPKSVPEIIMMIVIKKLISKTVINQLIQKGLDESPITLKPCLNFFSFSLKISVTVMIKLI